MSRGGKHSFRRVTSPNLRKQKKVMLRVPEDVMPTIKKLMIKYDIKGMQYLFDMLVVSGICFRREEILKFVRKQIPKYKEENTKRNLAKLKKKKMPKKKMYGYVASMYTSDNKTFHEYILEENIKQQWLWNALFVDGFAAEEKCIIDLVKRAKTLNLSSRKKAIARLSDDEYITTMPLEDARALLDKITKEYDQKIFDDSIESLVEAKLQIKAKQKAREEEDELEAALHEKISAIRKNRNKQIKKIIEPDLNID